MIESPNSKRRELTIESMEGSSRVVCKLWGDHADKCLPDIDEIVTICNVEVATFKDIISLNSTLLTSLKVSSCHFIIYFQKGWVHLWAPLKTGKINIQIKHIFPPNINY